MNIIDPTEYGLNKRTKLEAIDKDHIGIVKLLKSRIIRKDAEKIIETADKIKATNTLQVSLICTSNICSKSVKLLNDNSIGIVYREI